MLLRVVVARLMSLAMLGAGVASGQDFPNKVIRIVSTEAGGGNDFVARIIAQALTGNLGQQVIVEGSSPQELAATIKSEMDSMGKVIKDAGIRGE